MISISLSPSQRRRPTKRILFSPTKRRGAIALALAGFFHAPLEAQTILAAAAAAPVDPSFVSPLTASPGVLAVQADGKIIVNGTIAPTPAGGRVDLVRLNPNGSLDSSFLPSAGMSYTGIEVLPDGFMLAAYADTVMGGDILVRLLPDGTVDSNLQPIHGAGPHIVLADRRIVVAKLANNTLTLIRYDAGGRVDTSYPETVIMLAPPASTGVDPDYNTLLRTTNRDGTIMVAAVSSERVGTGVFGRNESKILRLLADGTVDRTFAIVTVPDAIRQWVSTEGKLTYLATKATLLGSNVTYQTRRLNADGTADNGYRGVILGGSIPVFPVVQLAPDGGVFYAAANTRALAHYDREGALDPEFSARFAQDVTFSRLVPLVDGRLLATGNFTQLNGTNASLLARLSPDYRASATRLTNLSIRQLAGTGNQTLIVGFVIAGEGGKPMLLRGVGPTLASFNVAGPLPDPRLSLFDGAGALRSSNDNWSDDSNAALVATTSASVGAFALPANSKDAAALATLPSGAYTLQITSAGTANTTGVALAEGYDTGDLPANYSAARAINFSARANAGAGEATLIAGFTISGPNVKRVLVRAVGRTLEQFGVTDTLADPQLTLYSGATVIASNDNWGNDSDLRSAFAAVGAFPLGATDAALLITLPPGSYTAQIAGPNGGTGTALVEIYEVR